MRHPDRHRYHCTRVVRLLLTVVAWCACATGAHAEILIRWDQDRIPSRDSLGLTTVVMPARQSAAVQQALAQGYRLYLEIDAAAAATFAPPPGAIAGIVIKGQPSSAALAQLTLRARARGIAVRLLEERGKWPHVRVNWVTNNGGVLQVSSRSAQPWLENNAALIRIAQVTQPETTPLLTYPWQPITAAEKDEGPAVENYLVAIAEAGSFGADLQLPLHPRFAQQLLLGLPEARAAWEQIRRAIAFQAWDLSARYRRTANIGVTTTDAMRWFEVMNLLARHNLSFDFLPQAKLATRDLAAFDLVIVLDQPSTAQLRALDAFAQRGGTVVLAAGLKGDPQWTAASSATPPPAQTDTHTTVAVGKGRVVQMTQPIANPDDFAMEMRQLIARERRPFEIWNGITVIGGHYTAPDDGTVMLAVVNYAHQPLPVQLRVRGRFSAVRYESPDERAALLPFQQRDGETEFVLPALEVGARLFLTREASPAVAGAGSKQQND